jgi:hypothetical protein
MKLSEYFITRIKLLLCLSGRLEKIILHAHLDRDIDLKRVIDEFLIDLLIMLI